MHKTILILLLIVTANSVWADWAEMVSELGGDTHYIDQTNTRKNGQFVKVWMLTNLKEEKYGIASFVSLMEYDCNEERMRYLSKRAFSGQMGSGTSFAVPLERTGLEKWEYIPPEAVGAFIQALVCHEWVKLDKNVYFDTISIRRNGQFVTSWILFDNMLTRNSHGVTSARVQYEIDCKGLKSRSRVRSGHSDSMATGNVVAAGGSIAEWESIDSGLLNKSMLSIVCD